MSVHAINILIIEDDEFVAEEISFYLKKKNFNVVAIASTLKEAIGYYYTETIDFIIIDIFLNGERDGIKFANIISKSPNGVKPFLFLTGSFSKSVFDEAKLTHPYNYLIKPCNELELLFAIELALEKSAGQVNTFNEQKHPSILLNQTLYIKKNNSLIKVVCKDILYLSVEDKYSKVVTSNENFIIQMSLKQFLNTISPSTFIRIHRNYIINIHKIKKIYPKDNLVLLENNESLTISKHYRKEFMMRHVILS